MIEYPEHPEITTWAWLLICGTVGIVIGICI